MASVIIRLMVQLTLTATLVGCHPHLSHQKIASASPEQVFSVFIESINNGDFARMSACLSEGSQQVVAKSYVRRAIGSAYLADGIGFNREMEKVPTISGILEKHGITKSKYEKAVNTKPAPDVATILNQMVALISDKPAFIGKISKVLDEKEKITPHLHARLEEVKTVNNIAKGKYSYTDNDRKVTSEIEFRKEGRNWRVDIVPDILRLEAY